MKAGSDLVEQQLYSAFAPDSDYAVGEQMRRALPVRQWALIERMVDPRLREFAERMAYEQSRDALPKNERQRMDTWVRDRLLGPADAPWTTLAKARVKLATLAQSGDKNRDPFRIRQITEYYDYLERNANVA